MKQGKDKHLELKARAKKFTELGLNAHALCKKSGLPHQTLYDWLMRDGRYLSDELAQQFDDYLSDLAKKFSVI